MNFVIFLLNFDEILSEFHDKFQEIVKNLNILRNNARKIRKMLESSGFCEECHSSVSTLVNPTEIPQRIGMGSFHQFQTVRSLLYQRRFLRPDIHCVLVAFFAFNIIFALLHCLRLKKICKIRQHFAKCC